MLTVAVKQMVLYKLLERSKVFLEGLIPLQSSLARQLVAFIVLARRKEYSIYETSSEENNAKSIHPKRVGASSG